MRFIRSTNPVIRSALNNTYLSDKPVTYGNVAFKSLFLIGIVFVGSWLTITYAGSLPSLNGLLIGSLIVGFISVIIGTRSVKLAPIFGVIYALSEGILLTIISAMFAVMYDGIIPTALATTLIVFVIMLLLYSTKIINVNRRFASIMMVSIIAVIIMGIISIIFPFGGSLYYLYVVFSAVLSAFFLLMDFKSIETCVESGTDARTGWILALGLLVTIVWIYIEMLRILALFSRRR